MVPLLWSKAYGEPVLEGFIASIGGLDGRLRRSVSAAIAKRLAEGDLVWLPVLIPASWSAVNKLAVHREQLGL